MNEQEQEVVIEEVLPPEAPLGQEEPVSLRDQIVAARNKAIEPKEDVIKEEVPKEEKKIRARAEDGKFAKAPKEVSQPVIEQDPKLEAPQSYSAAVKAKWKELPTEIQQELTKREQDFHKELTKHDEERVFGRQIKSVVAPYEAMIRAEGGTPDKAVADLLNTAYLLRTASPQQKGQLIWQVARQFGADMSNTQQAQAAVDPRLHQLQQKLEQVEGTLKQQLTLKEQQEQAAIHGEIQSFAAAPGHEHFEAVKAHMAALLSNNLAKSMQDAYDQAVYARPDIRSTLLEKQTADLAAKRIADTKAKAEAAKRAGSSVKGSPGMVAAKNGAIVHSNLRDELKANLRAYQDG